MGRALSVATQPVLTAEPLATNRKAAHHGDQEVFAGAPLIPGHLSSAAADVIMLGTPHSVGRFRATSLCVAGNATPAGGSEPDT